jgi:dihydropteroate synthase
VVAELRRQIALAEGAGVAAERILVDPGFGFGKTWRENFEIMRRLAELQVLDKPVLVGPSRKGMIARVLGAEAGNRVEGSAALVAVCIAHGADVVRVHDAREMARVARIMDALVRPRTAAPLPTSRPAAAQRQEPAQEPDEPHP